MRHKERQDEHAAERHGERESVVSRGVPADHRATGDVRAPSSAGEQGEEHARPRHRPAGIHEQQYARAGHEGERRVARFARSEQGDGERPEEFDGDRDAERYPLDRRVEAEIHCGDGDSEPGDAGKRAPVDPESGPPEQQGDRTGDDDAQAGDHVRAREREELFGHGRAELNGHHRTEHEQRRGHPIDGASSGDWSRGTRRYFDRSDDHGRKARCAK
ncbi:hypothetical protein [Nocardia bhagyanarayanae]|uniref:hypothetical protein n=1 Tax=Nocardia bhagyanarayanae TaxID=1215925 RepID=UPI001639CB4F|nr:hypothetical protein [Nocardia bhagyanarayanae]